MSRKFFSNVSQNTEDKVLDQIPVKFTRTKIFEVKYAVDCGYNHDIDWHYVDKLKCIKDSFGKSFGFTKKIKV